MAGETRQSAQLRICIRDNNQTGLKGGVIFYEVSSQGGIHADYLFDKTGFCDTVVDIDEKYRGPGETSSVFSGLTDHPIC